MKNFLSLLILTLLVSLNVFAADDLYTPKTQGSVSIIDNTGRIWQAQVVYTTDGNGNVLPISSGGGGGGGLTDAELRATPVPVSGTFYQATQPVSIAAPVAVTLPSSVKTPGLLAATSAGTVAAGAVEVSFLVTGAGDATVLGVSLSQGAYVNYQAPLGSTLGAIIYDATGTTLKISEVR